MAVFRKKSGVVVEATQWFENRDHPEDGNSGEGKVVQRFRRPDVHGGDLCFLCDMRFHDHGWIDTLKGGHKVCPRDWIINGAQGERYPCKPDIFEQTYELVANPWGRRPHG